MDNVDVVALVWCAHLPTGPALIMIWVSFHAVKDNTYYIILIIAGIKKYIQRENMINLFVNNMQSR